MCLPETPVVLCEQTDSIKQQGLAPKRRYLHGQGKAGSREAQGRLQEQLVPGHWVRKGFERGREACW